MCTMRVAIRREMLGAREQAWSIWTGKDVMELTANAIKTLLKAGTKVCGLRFGKSGELELDKDGFYTTNLMEHRHAGNYKPMIEDASIMANIMYTVIGKHEENGQIVYDCISSKFEQAKLSEEEVKVYLKLGVICSGAKLDGEKVVVASLENEKAETPKEETKPVSKVEPPKTEPKAKDKK